MYCHGDGGHTPGVTVSSSINTASIKQFNKQLLPVILCKLRLLMWLVSLGKDETAIKVTDLQSVLDRIRAHSLLTCNACVYTMKFNRFIFYCSMSSKNTTRIFQSDCDHVWYINKSVNSTLAPRSLLLEATTSSVNQFHVFWDGLLKIILTLTNQA